MNSRALLILPLALLMAAPAEAGRKKKKYDTWDLDVVFIIGTDAWETNQSDVEAWIKKQVRRAEETFDDQPRLDIHYTLKRDKKRGGVDTSHPTFDTNGQYRRWMDKHVDNVATSKTKGHLTVLVVDEFCIKNKKRKAKKTGDSHKCPGGRAWFPHWITPFARKTGIALRYKNDQYTLAHEIGHFLGLKHTFEPYTSPDPRLLCNKDYKKGKKGHCSSCTGKVSGKSCSSSSNVMDYCSASTQFLNACQKRRAANQRRKYMTRKGETNYRKLTGRR